MNCRIETVLIAVCLAAFVAPFCFSQTNDGSDLFVVIVGDKRGFIDRNGKIVIEPKWSGANDFSEGRAVVATYDGGYSEGFIDTTGKVVVDPQFPMARDFSEGLAAVGFGEFGMHNSGDHTTGFIDKTGKLVIKPKYRDAGDFSEGLAMVCQDEKCGYIDKSGSLVIPIKFDSASDFSEGLASVRIKKKWGYIDRTGKFVVRPKYSWADSFSEGFAAVKTGGNIITNDQGSVSNDHESPEVWSYINKSGKVSIHLAKNVSNAEKFSEGLAAVEVVGVDNYTNTGYVDRTGNFIIKPQFGMGDSFEGGLALIIEDGFGFIDMSGKIVMKFSYPTEYAMVNRFKNGLASVQKGGEDVFKNFREARYGYIDKTGKVIWQPTR